MMGEVYIVKKKKIENPLNFLLLDFPEIFWVFHVDKKSSDKLFLFLVIVNVYTH